MNPNPESPDRYAPEFSFPSYAYVPGRHPHPSSLSEGHRFGHPEETPLVLDLKGLKDNRQLRFGLDLFNAGYYWEAHEVWEGLWHAAGREGSLADLFKGLIKLAAAGVKAREGNENGVIKHANRAAELLSKIRCSRLAQSAKNLETNPIIDSAVTMEGNPVLPIRLSVEDLMPEDTPH